MKEFYEVNARKIKHLSMASSRTTMINDLLTQMFAPNMSDDLLFEILTTKNKRQKSLLSAFLRNDSLPILKFLYSHQFSKAIGAYITALKNNKKPGEHIIVTYAKKPATDFIWFIKLLDQPSLLSLLKTPKENPSIFTVVGNQSKEAISSVIENVSEKDGAYFQNLTNSNQQKLGEVARLNPQLSTSDLNFLAPIAKIIPSTVSLPKKVMNGETQFKEATVPTTLAQTLLSASRFMDNPESLESKVHNLEKKVAQSKQENNELQRKFYDLLQELHDEVVTLPRTNVRLKLENIYKKQATPMVKSPPILPISVKKTVGAPISSNTRPIPQGAEIPAFPPQPMKRTLPPEATTEEPKSKEPKLTEEPKLPEQPPHSLPFEDSPPLNDEFLNDLLFDNEDINENGGFTP